MAVRGVTRLNSDQNVNTLPFILHYCAHWAAKSKEQTGHRALAPGRAPEKSLASWGIPNEHTTVKRRMICQCVFRKRKRKEKVICIVLYCIVFQTCTETYGVTRFTTKMYYQYTPYPIKLMLQVWTCRLYRIDGLNHMHQRELEKSTKRS